MTINVELEMLSAMEKAHDPSHSSENVNKYQCEIIEPYTNEITRFLSNLVETGNIASIEGGKNLIKSFLRDIADSI